MSLKVQKSLNFKRKVNDAHFKTMFIKMLIVSLMSQNRNLMFHKRNS